MNVRPILVRGGIAVAVLVALLVALTLWPAPRERGAGAAEEWTCSMHPQVRLPAPGQCPICGMNLVPVSQGPAERSRLEAQAGIETASVAPRPAWKEVRTVGRLDYSERRVADIAARVAGRVERVYADFTGLEVKRGDHLVDLYSPELYTAQRELLLTLDAVEAERRTGGTERPPSALLLEAARARLRLWGILPEQIEEFERTRQPRTHVTIFAPLGGIVIQKERTVELVADNPGDWAFHCHKPHHTMNAMGHELPNTIGADLAAAERRIRALVPGYMAMGSDGMASMTQHLEHMRGPRNTLPMMGGAGPFGPLEMGGMFMLFKVRDGITTYEDPGWYAQPDGTRPQRVDGPAPGR